MHFTGVLDDLLSQGRDICFISNIDNTGATIDLRIAKLMVESDLEYVMECTEKTEVDRKVIFYLRIFLLLNKDVN